MTDSPEMPRVLALVFAGLVAVGAARAEGTGTLTVNAAGFKHARGPGVAKLFAQGDNVMGAARWQRVVSIEAGAAAFSFDGLPDGRYAVVLFHDENDNLAIDHGLLGPSEPLGFSGGFGLSLLSGRPNFEQLKFDFKAPAQLLEVSVR